MESKQIPGHRQYQITSDGVITRTTGARKANTPIRRSFHKVRGHEYPNGYYYVTILSHDFLLPTGEIIDCPCLKPIAVHRLLCLTFIDKPSPKHTWVNHKDGNKINNNIDNIEWTTVSQNIKHAFDTGLKVAKKGAEHHLFGKHHSPRTKAAMSEAKIGRKHPKYKGDYIANFKRFESALAAGKYLNVASKTISARCNNPKWKIKGFYFIPKQPLI